MKRFSLVDQIIFMRLNALVKDGYIFSLVALIYISLNNDTKLKDGKVEFKRLLVRAKIKFFRKIMMPM